MFLPSIYPVDEWIVLGHTGNPNSKSLCQNPANHIVNCNGPVLPNIIRYHAQNSIINFSKTIISNTHPQPTSL